MENMNSDNSVAVITTGGTIGSVATDSVRHVKENQDHISGRIKAHCNTYGIELDVSAPINGLSETFEPADWATIVQCIDEKVSEGYDSIIVTHGTDTMVYTAAAAYLTRGKPEARIIFTGAMKGEDSPDSDVEIALKSSLQASVNTEVPYGVYVNLRSPQSVEETHLYPVVDVNQLTMCDMGFRSVSGTPFGIYSEQNSWEFEIQENTKNNKPLFAQTPTGDELNCVRDKVQLRTIQPGITLSPSNMDEETEILILSTYHSGTGPNGTRPDGLKQFIEGSSVSVILAGVCSDIVPEPYETTVDLCDSGAELVPDVQPYILYVVFCIGLSLGFSKEEILRRLEA